jgi:lactonase
MVKIRSTLAAAFVVALGLGGTAVATAATKAPAPAAVSTNAASSNGGQNGQGGGASKPRVIVAKQVAKVAPLDMSAAFGTNTLLEGPAFGPDGDLYFVNLTAPANDPKILKLNVRTKQTTPVLTDHNPLTGFSSLQFSPADGRIYVTDFNQGNIDSLKADGSNFQPFFTDAVDGTRMVPDDIAFNPSGDMYITDYQGSPFNLIGRLIRLDTSGNATVLQDGLSAPNGISFTPDFSGLWVSELTLGREDHFTLSADGKTVAGGSVGMTANIGLTGFDSNSVDSAGNVYQCVVGGGKVLVWNTDGDLIATIVVPQDLPQPETLVTNLAIKPGTTDGYLTVGGGNGGYIYKFRALAPGIPQSNGGGA